MSHGAALLVLDADADAGAALAGALAADGYRVALARSAGHARSLARSCPPQLALIGAAGGPRGPLSLLEEIRAAPPTCACWERSLAVIVLGGACELDALRAFEAGADDVVSASTGYLELRARVRAVLRRTAERPAARGALRVGELLVQTDRRTASLAGRELRLRRLEFDLLVHLAREPRRVFTRAELLGAVWGLRGDAATRTLDSHASRLRAALGTAGPGPWVLGVRGVGYRLI